MVVEFAREVAASIVAAGLRRDQQMRDGATEVTTRAIEGELPFTPIPDEFPAWNKRTIRNKSGTHQILSEPGKLGGILVTRGAGDCLVLAYDREGTTGTLEDIDIAAAASALATANNVDGFVNMPVQMYKGIVITISQPDAIVTVYFVANLPR